MNNVVKSPFRETFLAPNIYTVPPLHRPTRLAAEQSDLES